MAEPIHEKIKQSLQAAEGLYHRLVLLVGKTGSGKTVALNKFADNHNLDVINMNLVLSAGLLELTAKQRVLRLSEILDSAVGKSQSVVIIDNLEILFDSSLKQDPLRLLQGISRNRPVLASWNGKVSRGSLIYAEAGHPEYRRYDMADTLIVAMDGTATIDSENDLREAQPS